MWLPAYLDTIILHLLPLVLITIYSHEWANSYFQFQSLYEVDRVENEHTVTV